MVFDAIDPKRPATTSKKAVKLMRAHLGFGGLIMTDDLSMKALSGSLRDRAEASLKADCDVVLPCNVDRAQMPQVAEATGRPTPGACTRGAAAMLRTVASPACCAPRHPPCRGHATTTRQ